MENQETVKSLILNLIQEWEEWEGCGGWWYPPGVTEAIDKLRETVNEVPGEKMGH